MYNFAARKWNAKIIADKNAMGATGLASIGAGIGAIREVGKLRDKINKRYAEECAKADARGEPRPPRPDTSTKTLMAVLKGSIKGAVVGTAVGFIPGVGRGLKDTVASLGAAGNKFLGGNTLGANTRNANIKDGKITFEKKSFSFINTFLPKDGEVLNDYTLSYLTDQDFSEIDLNNLDIGEVTEMDLYKMFFSLAYAAGQSFTKQDLYNFARKKVIQDNSLTTDADVKLLGVSKAAMPVLGALAGGGIGAVKARKRALERWEAECKIAEAQGRPLPPKPSILTLAGDVAKGAGIGAGIGWVGSKIAPNLNKTLSSKLAKYGVTGAKNVNRAAKSARKNAITLEEQETGKRKGFLGFLGFGPHDKVTIANFSVTFDQYRAALARKGQQTSLTAEQFANIDPEHYDIILRNMQPMNFNKVTDALSSAGSSIKSGAGKIGNKLKNGTALQYMGNGALLGAGTATILGCVKAGKEYEEYKAEAEAKGETPISKAKYILTSKKLLRRISEGAGEGLTAGALIYAGKQMGQDK